MVRRSPAELEAEYHRVFDAVEDATAVMRELHGEDYGVPLCRDGYIAAVDRGEATWSELLAGANEALSDLSPRGSRYPDERAAEDAFLAAYSRRTGRSFWEDAPQPKRRLRVLLAAGPLCTEEDARFVQDMLADGAVPQRARPAAEALLAGFAARPHD